jgi:hypothetical protein
MRLSNQTPARSIAPGRTMSLSELEKAEGRAGRLGKESAAPVAFASCLPAVEF